MNNKHQTGDTIEALTEMDYICLVKGFVLHVDYICVDEFVLNPHTMIDIVDERLKRVIIFVGENYINKMAGHPRMVLLEKNKIWKDWY